MVGGFGSAVREVLDRHGRFGVKFLSLGLPVEVYPMGKTAQIKKALRLDAGRPGRAHPRILQRSLSAGPLGAPHGAGDGHSPQDSFSRSSSK